MAGSLAKACEKLRLAQPTISGQIRELEDMFGEKLFSRIGRKLVLTDIGQEAYRYAEETFTLGQELINDLKGGNHLNPFTWPLGTRKWSPKWWSMHS